MTANAGLILEAEYKLIGVDTLNVVFHRHINLEREGQKWVDEILRLTGEHWRPKVTRSYEKISLNENKIKDELKIGLHVAIAATRIEVQFHGYWFLFSDAWERALHFCKELNLLTKQGYYVTAVHLRQDFFDKTDVRQVLPAPSEKIWYSWQNGNAWPEWYVMEGEKKVMKTLTVQNSRNEVTAYRKDLENSEQSNGIKKALMEKILNGRTMVRLETKLIGQDSCKIATAKLLSGISEETFVRDTLGSWALKHSIRERPRKWKKTRANQWPLWKQFEELFFRKNPGNVLWQQLTAKIKIKGFKPPQSKVNPYQATVAYVAKMKYLGLKQQEIHVLVGQAARHAQDRVDAWRTSRNLTLQFMDAVREHGIQVPMSPRIPVLDFGSEGGDTSAGDVRSVALVPGLSRGGTLEFWTQYLPNTGERRGPYGVPA